MLADTVAFTLLGEHALEARTEHLGECHVGEARLRIAHVE